MADTSCSRGRRQRNMGREIATLVNEHLDPGSYTVCWDASGVPGGVYFYRLDSDSWMDTKKLIVLKKTGIEPNRIRS